MYICRSEGAFCAAQAGNIQVVEQISSAYMQAGMSVPRRSYDVSQYEMLRVRRRGAFASKRPTW